MQTEEQKTGNEVSRFVLHQVYLDRLMLGMEFFYDHHISHAVSEPFTGWLHQHALKLDVCLLPLACVLYSTMWIL